MNIKTEQMRVSLYTDLQFSAHSCIVVERIMLCYFSPCVKVTPNVPILSHCTNTENNTNPILESFFFFSKRISSPSVPLFHCEWIEQRCFSVKGAFGKSHFRLFSSTDDILPTQPPTFRLVHLVLGKAKRCWKVCPIPSHVISTKAHFLNFCLHS